MKTYKHIIVGGGTVAGYAARELAQHNVRPHDVLIISAEPSLPYERPPLSKAFLAGKKQLGDILINAPEFYSKHGIDVLLNTRAVHLDTQNRVLRTEPENTYQFENLLLATGSDVRKLDVPGADLTNLYYLRSHADALLIRRAARLLDRAVVIGGGFIGLETAAVVSEHLNTTSLVFNSEFPMPSLFTAEMGQFFVNYYKNKGVLLFNQETVSRFLGNGVVSDVLLESGRSIKTDMILVGIGVEPELTLMRATPIQLEDGVLVDSGLQTSVPGIFAAGDIARYPDALTGKRRRIEHWNNAVEQAKLAARNMTGAGETYREPPYFFSDMFDLSWEFWGDSAHADEVRYMGDVANGSFSAWWTDEGHVTATFVLNRPDEERKLAKECTASAQPLPERIQAEGRLDKKAVLSEVNR